jgi:MerR family transcriptional regulator, copper efflux regulator
MEGTLVTEAARATGWSARMLRYLERWDLVAPSRSRNGYRLYDAWEIELLRRLRELRARFAFELADVRFALRLRNEPDLRDAVDAWLDSRDPNSAAARDWQRWEQLKHERLLAAAIAA